MAADAKSTIGDVLRSMGAPRLEQHPDADEVFFSELNYQGTAMSVLYFEDTDSVAVASGIAQLPRANVAPLMRRVLEMNNTVIEGHFAIEQEMLVYRAGRRATGLDAVEVTQMCDAVAAGVWQVGVPIAREFGMVA